MEPFGEIFRQERLRHGLKLELIAADLKIGNGYLTAIEDNRFDCLPGGLYTREFVRQYARALGFSEEEVIAAVKQLEPPPLPDPPPPPKLEHFRQLGMYIWLVAVVFGCGKISTIWDKYHGTEHSDNVAGTIGHTKPFTSNQSDSAAIRQLENDVPPVPMGLVGSDRHMRIIFAAKEAVWLSIHADGVPVFTGTIDEEDCKEIDALDKVNVLVGNAGGLAISVNGSPVAVTGAHGEVRSLILTPSGVRVIPRIVPAAPRTTIQSKSVSLSE